MSQAEQNRQLVLRLFDALNAGDDKTLRDILHEDATWWVLSVGTMDRETLIDQMHAMLGNAKAAKTTIIGTTAEGQRVAVEAQGHFEFADGRVYDNKYHNLFTVRDNRVVSVKEYLDTALVARVFGEVKI